MAIRKDVTMTIFDNATANLDEKIYVYRKDSGIDFYFNIIKYKRNYITPYNILENLQCKVTAVIKKPNGTIIKNESITVVDNKIKFPITSDFVGLQGEVGTYIIQFYIIEGETNRMTIPPISLDVLESIDEYIK